MLVLEKQFVEREVFFPVFARYFLVRGQSFKIMIEDLFKHKGSRNDKPPLVLSAEVCRLRHIVHKRMGHLMAMYRLFKDTVSETEKDIGKITYENVCDETLSRSNPTIRSY
jgi:hypothetical protein